MDLYPQNTKFVICLGFHGEKIKQVASLIARENQQEVIFTTTNSWDDPKKGLSNTLLDSMDFLNSEFIFHAVDTLVTEKICKNLLNITPDTIVVAKPLNSGEYRILIGNEMPKKHVSPNSDIPAYIGLAKINGNKKFWDAIQLNAKIRPEDGETIGLNFQNLKVVTLTDEEWIDTGNVIGLQIAQKKYKQTDIILERTNEAIWNIGSKMYKFHLDEKFINNRVARAKSLYPYVPDVKKEGMNLYSYERIGGYTLSSCNLNIFEKFLKFLTEFWGLKGINNSPQSESTEYREFYEEKTKSRVAEFLVQRSDYNVIKINGKKVERIEDLLLRVPWVSLSKITRVRCHGDLHPDNVIVINSGEDFKLLDWRQDLAGSVSAFGDLYYDIAKIWHGLIVDHRTVSENRFKVNICKMKGTYDIDLVDKKIAWLAELKEYISINSLDLVKSELITALIFLNIAALHHHPYNEFLFLLGHDMLNNIII